MVRDASVFALVLKRGVVGEEAGGGEDSEDVGKEFMEGDNSGPDRSDWYD